MKKTFLIIIIFILYSTLVVAQSVGINNTTPHASAILDVKSNTKGMLMPRTSTTSRTAIVNPAKGLMIYDTTTSSFWFYSGSAWTVVASGNNTWNVSGNTGINPVNQFIGTTDEQPLRFRINNSWAGELHPTSGNIFLGLGSGQANTGGGSNTSMGEHSLKLNTDGSFNAAYGYESLSVNTTGYNNTAIGGYTLYNNTTGFANTAIGRNALFANTTGTYNTATGVGSLLTNTSGKNNTATGYQALYSNTVGDDNTASGYMSLYSNTTGVGNIASGRQALYLNTTGYYNTAIGFLSLFNNTVGFYNTAAGANTLTNNTTGNSNTANGTYALYQNSTGSNNTATGFDALLNNNTGSNNTAIGSSTLTNGVSGDNNTATGYLALTSNNGGNNNTASGYEALKNNSSGGSNTAAGSGSLKNNTTGALNTAAGFFALYSNTTGWYNTAVGDGALSNNTGGNNNIAIGFGSGTHSATPNIFNTISIGNDDILNAFQNQAFIGNTSTAWIGGKVTWSTYSDARIKNTIAEDVKGLDFILRLRPVTYHVSNKAIITLTGNKETADFPGKYDNEKIKYTGFIAQEVEQAAKAAGYDFSGYAAPKNQWGLYTISYEQFVVPLVKAMQEQQSIIEILRMQVEAARAEIPLQTGKQQAIITDQQKQIDRLEKRLAALEAKQ